MMSLVIVLLLALIIFRILDVIEKKVDNGTHKFSNKTCTIFDNKEDKA